MAHVRSSDTGLRSRPGRLHQLYLKPCGLLFMALWPSSLRGSTAHFLRLLCLLQSPAIVRHVQLTVLAGYIQLLQALLPSRRPLWPRSSLEILPCGMRRPLSYANFVGLKAVDVTSPTALLPHSVGSAALPSSSEVATPLSPSALHVPKTAKFDEF